MSDIDPRSFMEPAPSAGQKALWDQFIDEYVKDWSPIAACLRVGFNAVYAQEYGKVFLGQPYVQRKIMEYKLKPAIAEKDALEIARKRIESKLLELMECGDAKVMATATKTYAEMNGLMVAPDRSGEALEKLVDHFQKTATVLPD